MMTHLYKIRARLTLSSDRPCWLTPSHILGAGWISYCLGVPLTESLIDLLSVRSRVQAIPVLSEPELLGVGMTALCFATAWRVHLMKQVSVWLTPALCLTLTLSAALITLSQQDRLEAQRTHDHQQRLHRDLIAQGRVINARRRGVESTLIVALTTLVTEGSEGLRYQQRALTPPLTVAWRTTDLSSGVMSGDTVWLSGQLSKLSSAPSPELFDAETWWGRRGVTVRGRGSALLSRRDESRGLLRRARHALERFRVEISERLASVNSPGAALLQGVTLGDSALISQRDLRILRGLGLGHLLAVSGLHVGVVAGMTGGLCYLIALLMGSVAPRRWGVIFGALSAWGYVSLAGWPLSAQRAACMLTVWATLSIAWDLIRAQSAVWIAGWLLVGSAPSVGCEMGVQLSLLATISLCAWSIPCPHTSRYQERLMSETRSSKTSQHIRRLWRLMKLNLRASWCAWLMTSPIIAWHLGEVNFMSPICNALITPLVSALYIPAALISVLMSAVSDAPLHLMVWVGDQLMECVKYAPHKSMTTLSATRVVATSIGSVALAWALSASAARCSIRERCAQLLLDDQVMITSRGHHLESFSRRRASLMLGAVSCLLIAISLMCCRALIEGHAHPSSYLRFMSVGQGDATLIRNREGEVALFDVGPPRAGAGITRRLRRMGVQRISWIAVSHLHPDHYGGLSDLMEEFPIDQVISHGRPLRQQRPARAHRSPHSSLTRHAPRASLPTWSALTQRLDRLGVTQAVVSEVAMHWRDLELTWVLANPPQHFSENDASLALLVTGSSARVLLSGDLERRGERRLRDAWRGARLGRGRGALTAWQADHHGSATSTLPESLELLNPRLVVLSLDGAHRFAFPHPQTIRRLAKRAHSRVRLDLHGDLTLPLNVQ